jgi:myo-inositol-1(or 4)-monophosphatase
LGRRPDPELLSSCTDFAVDTLARAGATVLSRFRTPLAVDDKAEPGDFDPVTAADRDAEALIRSAIHERFPEHGIHGEEAGLEPGRSALGWTIDPVDGTRGFISGFIHWGMLLALTFEDEPLVGVVHQPYTGETWVGTPSAGWFERSGAGRRELAVRRCPDLAAAVLATTDPYLFTGSEARAFDAVRRRVRLTRYGADCYAYCMLAMGQLDLVVESGLGPWDVQALMPVVRAAGGVITDWDGGDCSGGGRVVAAGDARVHAEAMELLSTAGEHVIHD